MRVNGKHIKMGFLATLKIQRGEVSHWRRDIGINKINKEEKIDQRQWYYQPSVITVLPLPTMDPAWAVWEIKGLRTVSSETPSGAKML